MARITKRSRSKKQKLKSAKMADLIRADLDDPVKANKLLNEQPVDVDLPGLGQFYCIECDRYFVTADVLSGHKRTKVHKARCRRLKEEPYTIEESVLGSGAAPTDLGLRSQNMSTN